MIVPGRSSGGRARTTAEGRRGRGPGGLLLARYEAGSSLRYSELLGVGGLRATRSGAGFWIPFARVDDDASVAGGRAVWDIPKELAGFEWSTAPDRMRVSVSSPDARIVSVVAGPLQGSVTLPVLAPFLGLEARALGLARGVFRGGVARVGVDLPAGSPLHALGLAFSPVALVGRARLRVDALRPAGRE